MAGSWLCQKLTKFTAWQSKTRSPKYQCTHQVWWKMHWYLLVIIKKQKYGWMEDTRMDGWTDRWMDTQTLMWNHNNKPISCGQGLKMGLIITINTSTLTILWANSADNQLIFFFYFPENRLCHLVDNLKEMSKPTFWGKWWKLFQML